jgi:hypothetical protein
VAPSIREAATWAVLDPEARTIARGGVGLGRCFFGLDQMVDARVDARVSPAQGEGRREPGCPADLFSLIFEIGLASLWPFGTRSLYIRPPPRAARSRGPGG